MGRQNQCKDSPCYRIVTWVQTSGPGKDVNQTNKNENFAFNWHCYKNAFGLAGIDFELRYLLVCLHPGIFFQENLCITIFI